MGCCTVESPEEFWLIIDLTLAVLYSWVTNMLETKSIAGLPLKVNEALFSWHKEHIHKLLLCK